MKRIITLLSLGLVLTAWPAAAQVQVIANPSFAGDAVSAGDLKDIFLGNTTAVGGASVEPIFAKDGAAHDAFLKTYLGKSDAALKTYFKTLVFTGKGSQPKAAASDAEVVKFVASTKGAIGYVSPSAECAGVRIIKVK